MKQLTAERCKSQIAEWEKMMSVSDVAVIVELNLQAYRIALPVLEQQGEMVRVGFGSGSLEAIKSGGEGFIWGSREDAHPVELFARCKDVVCEKCNGTGQMDSGGTQSWGDAITVTCDCQSQPSTNPQIDHDGWVNWCGGDCPVESMAMVEVKFTQTPQGEGIAHWWDWNHAEGENNIIAYRVIEDKS